MIDLNEYHPYLFSALGYIEELFDLLTKNEDVQISENITEEAENVKVDIRRALIIEKRFFDYLEWTKLQYSW